MKKSLSEIVEFLAGDHTILKEVLHPKNDAIDLPYSLAYAKIEIGKKSLPHRLTKSSELYYFLEGEGTISIDGQSQKIKKSDIVLVPKNAEQAVENLGNCDLEFLCIVSPPWNELEEEIEN
ncbi:MAG: cupin domain-containing protein [Bacteroidetes bacterium]|jgi:mannose-6-phosphate isomerase-like protein (cupin superfamily)|nr:cupin domain-containing protein [Bacteroidota bacterium]MDF1865234.1 cupin domain-containing protein [Saprospiraceae bacterium]